MTKTRTILLMLMLAVVAGTAHARGKGKTPADKQPRIINIINFIRQTDYRVEDADRKLYETVCRQVELVNRYNLPATFLLEYDALINPLYQNLLKTKLKEGSEIGAWWELTQPQIEAAGLKWRGEYSWVSHANIAFSTGYTKEERERLVDVYMQKFKEIFGYYPKSVGSWFIDAHTLAYMHDKYGIEASCNCKDQIGTDGYTLWGGYWNQAYYPSRLNAYMPAQTAEGQIPVPIFRMLGSDPIYQYDDGLGNERQGVISLEPVYPHAGMNRKWVDYFFDALTDGSCLAFGYAQAGQENSFTWDNMRKGLEMQMPLIDSLRRAGRLRVETLGESGRWFRKNFKLTPATAVTTVSDVRGEGNKTVWYDSRNYRANLLWEKGRFRFRDIHLFDERFKSEYLDKPGTGNQFLFYTLPVIDGFMWSKGDDRAGLMIVKVNDDGSTEELRLDNPTVKERGKSVLEVSGTDQYGHTFSIVLRDDRIEVSSPDTGNDDAWALQLHSAPDAPLPFTTIGDKSVEAVFRGYSYSVDCPKGCFKEVNENGNRTIRICPDKGKIAIDCAR